MNNLAYCAFPGVQCLSDQTFTIAAGNYYWFDSFNNQWNQYDCPHTSCVGISNATTEWSMTTFDREGLCGDHRSYWKPDGTPNLLCSVCDSEYWEWNGICVDNCPESNWDVSGVVTSALAIQGTWVVAIHVLSQTTSEPTLPWFFYFLQNGFWILSDNHGILKEMESFRMSLVELIPKTCLGKWSILTQVMFRICVPYTLLVTMIAVALCNYYGKQRYPEQWAKLEQLVRIFWPTKIRWLECIDQLGQAPVVGGLDRADSPPALETKPPDAKEDAIPNEAKSVESKPALEGQNQFNMESILETHSKDTIGSILDGKASIQETIASAKSLIPNQSSLYQKITTWALQFSQTIKADPGIAALDPSNSTGSTDKFTLRQKLQKRYFRTFWTVYMATYEVVLWASLTLIPCVDKYLYWHPSLQCDSNAVQIAQVWNTFYLCVHVLVVPMVALWTLYTQSTRTCKLFGLDHFLLLYKDKFWMAIFLLRRLLCTWTVFLFPHPSPGRTIYLLCIHAISLGCTLVHNPYHQKHTLSIDRFTTSLMLIMCIIVYRDPPPYTGEQKSLLLSLYTIGLSTLGGGIFLVRFLAHLADKPGAGTVAVSGTTAVPTDLTIAN